MSRELNLTTRLVEVEAGNRGSLLCALSCISEFDCDFNGENGDTYTWDVALENGFESNMAYLLHAVENIENDGECVKTFIEEWVGHDSYYDQYEIDYLTDEKGRITVISFATICGY